MHTYKCIRAYTYWEEREYMYEWSKERTLENSGGRKCITAVE